MTSSDWAKFVETQHEIVNSREAHPRLGLPQPSWVGKNYQKGSMIVVAINPGNGNLNNRLDKYEEEFQKQLSIFKTSGADEEYHRYVEEVHRQHLAWSRWKNFGGSLLNGARLNIDEIGWLNVWKNRSEDGSGKFQVALGDFDSDAHVARFLFKELDVLQPSIIVTHGAPARDNVNVYKNRINDISVFNVPQRGYGCSQEDIFLLGQRIGIQLRESGNGVL